jgi:hypothetical protein
LTETAHFTACFESTKIPLEHQDQEKPLLEKVWERLTSYRKLHSLLSVYFFFSIIMVSLADKVKGFVLLPGWLLVHAVKGKGQIINEFEG